ncbi:G8 domain-containing protein [Lyngbya aestuarii]|uniref:G8 domain-containing protein n=1 Tax=Lyngbya aestuarii TaxID=118322 RepID=UPI00403D75ED
MDTQINTPTSTHHPHPGDPKKQKEHLALLDLVPDAKATHVAVKDGSWFDPKIWQNGKVPGDGAKVVIGENHEVTYDRESKARLETLRVDGQLEFADDKNTMMVVDTFVVAPSGTLTIGTEANPIQGDKTTRIIIADNGPIDLKWDPEQLSRGIISHGAIEIHGQEKASHLKLAKDPMAGDKELILAEKPTNWKVGDSLVLTGTHYVADKWNGQRLVWQGTQDEELEIVKINGNKITVDRSLKYNHDTPKDDLKAYVANYSRNVVFETENFESLPANQRGHVMFMHSDDVDVRYAEFFELGRTDKSKPLDDFRLDGNGKRILDGNGDPISGKSTNVRGRYAVHFHRTGADDISGQPAIAIGNAVWGSPGWGFVQHDSNAILNDNAAYDVFGSAFVSETGNEIGAWENNIAIKSEGILSISKDGSRVNNHDIAHNGSGFWFQGRLVANENNIAAGQRNAGITYLLRGVDQKDIPSKNLAHPEIAHYNSTVDAGKPEIQDFHDNEVLASGKGLEVIKANQKQGHDVRSVIDGLKAWEVSDGFEVQYTSKYTFKDITLIGSESSPDIGAHLAQNAEDMVINNAHIEGFKTGINFRKTNTLGKLNDWSYVLIDTKLANNKKDINNFDAKTDKILTSADLKPGTLKLELDSKADFILDPAQSDRKAVISGTKTDSIGRIPYPSGLDTARFEFHKGLNNLLSKGYYTDKDGTRFIIIEDLISDRATGEVKEIDYAVTIDDSWKEATLGSVLGKAPRLGVYNGQIEGGPLDDAVLKKLNYTSIGSVKGVKKTFNDQLTDSHQTNSHQDDLLLGSANDDILVGQVGDHVINGGAGMDTLVFSGNQADYTFTSEDGGVSIDGPDGSNFAVNIELMQFGTDTPVKIQDLLQSSISGETGFASSELVGISQGVSEAISL